MTLHWELLFMFIPFLLPLPCFMPVFLVEFRKTCERGVTEDRDWGLRDQSIALHHKYICG